MLNRLLQIAIFISLAGIPLDMMAQMPENITIEGGREYLVPSFEKRACNDAGTIASRTLIGNNQSNNIRFLCFGDSLSLQHTGDFDISMDPNPTTQAGVGYAIYSCAPTIDGMDLASILTDPCRVVDPPPAGDLWIVTDQQNGNALFSNITFPGPITIPEFYNNGDPVRLFYAPITVDDFDNNRYEQAGGVPPAGPCVDVSIDEAFPLVYLNPVTYTIDKSTVDCDCNGDFVLNLEGGLPEFDGFTDYDLTIRELSSGVDIISNQAVSRGQDFLFSVTNPGIYEIIVDDLASCDLFAAEDLCSGSIVQVNIADTMANVGEVVCLPVSLSCIDNLSAFQFTLEYDTDIIDFNSFNNGIISISPANYNDSNPGLISFSWDAPNLDSIPLSDGDIVFEICFTIVGDPGESSDVCLTSGFTTFLIASANGNGGFNSFTDGDIIQNKGSVSVTSIGPRIVDTVIQNILTCWNDSVGSIDITVVDGTMPYNFNWQTPTGIETTEDLTDLRAGNYFLTITDSDMPPNVVMAQFEITAPPELIVTTSSIPECNGDRNGCLIVESVTGGTPQVNYEWSDQFGTQILPTNPDTICGLSAGLYFLGATDANGCNIELDETIDLESISVDLDVLASVLTVGCNANDGEIGILISGGDISVSGQYTINWSNNVMNVNQIDNLSAGAYTVTVTDDFGCETIETYNVTSSQGPMITGFDSTSVSCPNAADGSLTVNFTPTANTTIEWSTGDDTNTITGLSSGVNYIVTITDQAGCMVIDSVTLGGPQVPDFGLALRTNVSCFGYDDGRIELVPLSPLGNITIQWSNGDQGLVSDSLEGNVTHTAILIGGNNQCNIDTLSFLITQPPAIDILITAVQAALCFNQQAADCDGRATVTASGGNAPNGLYSIEWSTGQIDLNTNTSTNIQLCSGMNYFTVTDEVGCEQVDSIDIGAASELLINDAATEIIQPSCRGFSDGEISIVAEGGTPPYSAVWLDNSTGLMRTGLAAGNYSVTVSDNNGCPFEANYVIAEPDSFYIIVDLDSSQLTVGCAGLANGRIELITLPVGSGAVTYDWNPVVSFNSIADNLTAGRYVVTAENASGCADTASALISGVPDINFDIPPIIEPICAGQQAKMVVENATGGNGAPYSYIVLELGVERDIGDTIDLFAGDYTVSVVDRDGCTGDTMIRVNQPTPLVVNLPHDTIIRGQELILAELGEERQYSYQYTPAILDIDSVSWSFEESDVDFRYLQPDSSVIAARLTKSQTLMITIRDENGCLATDEIYIKVDRDRNVFLPTAFSPNNDNRNDVFAVYSGTGVRNIKSFKVFNRWGSLIYELYDTQPLVFNSNAVGWDGSHDGKALNPDVFVYLVEVEFEDDVTLLFRGDVTLVR